MNIEILKIASKLKEEIVNSEVYINLINSEKIMEENKEVIDLAILKEKAVEKYSDLLKYYKDDSHEVILARKELYVAKANFESHPLVREYLNNYQKLRLILEEINCIIFEDFKEQLCPNIK